MRRAPFPSERFPSERFFPRDLATALTSCCSQHVCVFQGSNSTVLSDTASQPVDFQTGEILAATEAHGVGLRRTHTEAPV